MIVLINGYTADKLRRKLATVLGGFVFVVGVIVQACAKNADFILGGRLRTSSLQYQGSRDVFSNKLKISMWQACGEKT